jgi:hypothetical protein
MCKLSGIHEIVPPNARVQARSGPMIFIPDWLSLLGMTLSARNLR